MGMMPLCLFYLSALLLMQSVIAGSIEGFGPRKRIGRSSMKHICLIGITGMFPASTNYHSTTRQDGWSTYNGCNGVRGLISWSRTLTSM
jgi:hypothetical protein